MTQPTPVESPPVTPPRYVGLAGRKGSGKSTLADALVEHGYVPIALADPLKQRLAALFALDPEFFFGPTALKEAPLSNDIILSPAYWTGVWARWQKTGYWRDLLEGASEEALARSHDHAAWAFSLLASSPEVSPRKIMQVLATEYARQLHPPAWTNEWRRVSAAVQAGALYHPRTGLLPGACGAPPTGVVCHDLRFLNECAMLRSLGGRVFYLDADSRIGPRVDTHSSEPLYAEIAAEVDTCVRTGTIEQTRDAVLYDLGIAPYPTPAAP